MSIGKKELREFVSHYAPYRLLLTADLLASLSVAALSLALPICVRYITNHVLASAPDSILPEILRISLLMLSIIAAQTAFTVFSDYKGHDMGAKIERDMRLSLFAQYQRLPLRFFDSQQTGQLMSRLTNDLLDLTELYHHAPENLAIYGTQFVGSLVILLHIHPGLTLVACALLPVMALYSFVFYRKLQTSYAVNKERIADVNARAEESLSGVRTVKRFAAEAWETEAFARENERFYKSRADIYRREALHYSVIDKFFTQLITVAIIAAGGIWIAQGTLAPSDLLIFILYAGYLTGPVPRLAFMVQQYQEGLAGYRRFREIMRLTPETHDAEGAEAKTLTGHVAFENVSFRYGEEQPYVLRNVSFCVSPGETVAIVGHSGIGKTTLCSLISRLYDPCEGQIRMDGTDARAIALRSLRGQIGVVGQETFLFSGTVMENIRYGHPDATPEAVILAARQAGAHEFILSLPGGYQADIGQRGVKLSGGQRQRLCIARVFLKNPPILVFDEATSALDYESERAVMEGLHALANERTAFIIAHRLSTVRSADKILVLSDGGIAEQGTHEALLATGGVYAALYRSQEA